MDAYRGTEGTRPYAGAGWYYAEYRQRVSTEFLLLLAARLGWTRAERLLDLGAGPACANGGAGGSRSLAMFVPK